jgi:regulator of protease activity HflC (stomatin/prohibitin superfamily)
MADVSRFLFINHLRAEASSHVLLSKRGRRALSGRGLSFWFLPMSSSIAELPVDDRELPVLFHGRSKDFQEVTTQGVISWRVADPERLADRVDFAIDFKTGAWVSQPLEQVAQLLTEMAQQVAWAYLAHHEIAEILRGGVEQLRTLVTEALADDGELAAMGLGVVTVRISSVRPTAEVEKALKTPTRERIQQEADKATFERRAIAVERERAIAENELQNKIELAKREQALIEQRGANERRRVSEQNEAAQLEAVSQAERARLHADSQAGSIRTIEAARAEAERATMDIYRELPQEVMLGLAARELAGNLPAVEHLTLSPELIGPALSKLADSIGKQSG